MPSAVPADHDDDYGRLAGRAAPGAATRRGFRVAAPDGHRDRGRIAVVTVHHALHDAGGLSLPGPVWTMGPPLAVGGALAGIENGPRWRHRSGTRAGRGRKSRGIMSIS